MCNFISQLWLLLVLYNLRQKLCVVMEANAWTSASSRWPACFVVHDKSKFKHKRLCARVRFRRSVTVPGCCKNPQQEQQKVHHRNLLNFAWKPELNRAVADAVKSEAKILALRAHSLWGTILNRLENSVLKENSNFVNEEAKLESELELEPDLDCLEQTLNVRCFSQQVSPAAVFSIEQFSRLNGRTGRKMQLEFELNASKGMHDNAQNLVEYCCFAYLSRNVLDVHPRLKDSAFRRLLFITMYAWQQPYDKQSQENGNVKRRIKLREMVIKEEAFVRITPAIGGLTDRATAHNVFKALARNKSGLHLHIWDAFILELLRVRQAREVHRFGEGSNLDLAYDEHILCTGTSKYPILKHDDNISWPGRLTLTDRALYFEANVLSRHLKALKFDLAVQDACVDKTKAGSFGLRLFDTGLSISSGLMSETWTLEFVDLQGHNRRDIWYAFIKEIISVHSFIEEYGPEENDPLMTCLYEARSGKSKVLKSAASAITVLQCLYNMQDINIEDPIKYIPFLYLSTVPGGELVYQAMAVEFWGSYLENMSKSTKIGIQNDMDDNEDVVGSGRHVFSSDGSVYLSRWMKSASWDLGESVTFWKAFSGRQGIVFGKNLVVGDKNLVERAVLNSRNKNKIYEKTQATIDAALVKGIPSNIDLFKEIMLPVFVGASTFSKLRRWEHPMSTVCFLAVAYTIIFKNWLHYILPFLLISTAVSMMTLKLLREQGKLGRNFVKVTIKEKAPLNTIQKIIGLRDALEEMEQFLQKLNVMLLKFRTILIVGNTQVSYKVAAILLASGTLLILLPFRYVCALFLTDLFTQELKFRRKAVQQFLKYVRDQWNAIPAAPVMVLPYDGDGKSAAQQGDHKELVDRRTNEEDTDD